MGIQLLTYRGGGRRGNRERGAEEEKKQREERQREEAISEETTHSAGEGVAEMCARTDRSDTEMDTYGGGEAGTSHSRRKKGHMMNIYLTDSDEEAIVDFVMDREELYDKTNKHFKDKARKECLWERFANSHKLSVKVYKTLFESQRTRCGKTHTVQVWSGSSGHYREAELDSG